MRDSSSNSPNAFSSSSSEYIAVTTDDHSVSTASSSVDARNEEDVDHSMRNLSVGIPLLFPFVPIRGDTNVTRIESFENRFSFETLGYVATSNSGRGGTERATILKSLASSSSH